MTEQYPHQEEHPELDQVVDYTAETLHVKHVLHRRLPLVLGATFFYYLIRVFDTHAMFNPVNSRIFEVLSIVILLYVIFIGFQVYKTPQEIYHQKTTYKTFKNWNDRIDFLGTVPYLMFVISVINVFFVSFSPISGTSMEPNFSDDEAVVFQHMTSSYDRFDIVIVYVEELNDPYLIKRVIGLPGETVLITNNNIYINGVLLEQDFIDQEVVKTYCISHTDINTCSFTVPDNSYFVLGDNRDGSAVTDQPSGYSIDSRTFGPVPINDMLGKVLFSFRDYNILD